MKRVGVDVGGTFTDLVYVDDERGTFAVHKVSSTPADPAVGVLQGTEELLANSGRTLADVDLFFYGTTLATNTLIQHNGVRVGLITTQGFRDILHIARKKRPLNFSSYQDLPWQAHPVIERRDRLTVRERIAADGRVLVPLDDAAVAAAARALQSQGVEAIAICFLFSFVNPDHERRAKEIVRETVPGIPVWTSVEVSGQYREYERFSTTAVNCYVGPPVTSHLQALQSSLHERGLPSRIYVMSSDGGAVTIPGACRRPIELVMSGPAAGLVAGIQAGAAVGTPSVISLDVGGTSADIGVAPDGEVRMKHLLDTKVAGYDLMLSMAEVETIGAGGGSIAYVDDGGMFRVGPNSAGAVPGPACYRRGGTEATATDAIVALGWIDPTRFLGGAFELDVEAAQRVVATLADKLGMTADEASLGVVRILVHHMVAAIGVHSTRKGYDPRDFALVALGGAGPMFACYVALELGIPLVVVPPVPGAGSAAGLLSTDLRYERALTVWRPAEPDSLAEIASRFAELEPAARGDLAEAGADSGTVTLERQVDLRYRDQGYELRVPAPAGDIDKAWLDECVTRFHSEHERRYLQRFDHVGVDVINAVVVASRGLPRLAFPEPATRSTGEPPVRAVSTTRWLAGPDGVGDRVDAPRFDRADLLDGDRIAGPALIDQLDTTTVIPPGMVALVTRAGHLEIRPLA